MSSIAIATTNKELARFFELELISKEYNVSLFNDGIFAAEEYDFIIVDIDTVSNFKPLGNRSVISVSSILKKSVDTGAYSLPWPTSIRDLHELCRKLTLENNISQASDNVRADVTDNKLYVVDRASCRVAISNSQIKLSKNEFTIIEALCLADGKAVSREKIIELINAKGGNISDVYICRLREKLELPVGKRLITTERGVGYKTSLTMVE